MNNKNPYVTTNTKLKLNCPQMQVDCFDCFCAIIAPDNVIYVNLKMKCVIFVIKVAGH